LSFESSENKVFANSIVSLSFRFCLILIAMGRVSNPPLQFYSSDNCTGGLRPLSST